jgi:hypothetical protein
MKKIPKLEGQKYGEIIIKVPMNRLDEYIEAIKNISIPSYEIKVYKTHFTRRVHSNE